MIDLRLRAYAPNGALLGLLPDALEAKAGLPLSDISSLTATYSRATVGGSLLDRDLGAGLELALEYSTPAGAWVEPRGGRFLWLKRNFDPADAADVVALSCPGYMWQLCKARVEKAPGVDLVDGKRAFLSATAGAILGTLLAEAQARGEVTGVTRSFTSMHDSAGRPWSTIITIYYEPGLDIGTVLANLTEQGVCDWSSQGRELQVYNPDTELAVDRTVGDDALSLRLGRDLTAAPSEESIEGLTSRAVLRGEHGLLLVVDNPTAPTPWGIWTSTISQGGVSDEGTARTLVQADLERGARVRGQYTRELVLATTAHDPLVTYAPGDYVMAAGATRSLERLRVRQVTLTKNGAGVSGNVVLNDRVIEAELRRARRMSGIVGGATSDGGSGARPAPEGPDRRVPIAPTGLVGASDAYVDASGFPRAQLTLTWAPVTTATDGTLLDKVEYTVSTRLPVEGSQWRSLLTTSAVTVSTSPFDVGSVHEFRVQAAGPAGVLGQPSAVVAVTMEADTTPPPVPSAPVLATRLGTVTVQWDGQTATGTRMPADFERVEVRFGDEVTGQVVGALRTTTGGDFLVLTGLAYGTMADLALRAIDRSGNASAWTAVSQIEVTVPDEDDLPPGTLTAPMFKAGAVDAVALKGDAIDGKTVTGALVRTAATGTRVELGNALLRAFNAGNVEVARIGGAMGGQGGFQLRHANGEIFTSAVEQTAAGVPVGMTLSVANRVPQAGTAFYVSAASDGSTIGSDAKRVQFGASDAASFSGRNGVSIFSHTGLVDIYTLGAAGVSIGFGGPNVVKIAHATYSGAANCGINGDGTILRSTSARRYKQDIEDLVVDPDVVLQLRPRTWRDRGEIDRDPECTTRYPGFIAEELVEAGLEQFVVYTPEGEVDAIAYDRLTAALVPVLQRQQRQLDEQATTLAALAAKVAALEGAR
ncbi:tail fiber domain-containing protein [Oerskovia paurometabola]|uniref:tail fiber domain-containing protein n=1 Tax=Oerskovia paurometabola TaxID=162170 RepID=UPI00382DB213